MVKYTFNWVSQKENQKLFTHHIELPTLETVFEAIRDILPFFNQKLSEEGSAYILVQDPNLFELYKSKRNGHAKTDYPGKNNFKKIKLKLSIPHKF